MFCPGNWESVANDDLVVADKVCEACTSKEKGEGRGSCVLKESVTHSSKGGALRGKCLLPSCL